MSVERDRLREADEHRRPWRRWGAYLSDRQWGTVREDYSAGGLAWQYIPHEQARSRAYRWGEDGLLGFCDEGQVLCLAPALWNGADPILKERLFGLTGLEGNHGEDVKEVYHHLDATPTHSYLKALYRYPQGDFPYLRLVEENRRRSREDPELELEDTGAFDGGRYFDVVVEYAKVEPEDVLVRLTAHNRGPDRARLHLIPQLWFRNTWSWGRWPERPSIALVGERVVEARHAELGTMHLHWEGSPNVDVLFCENETNLPRLFGVAARGPFKDGFHDAVVSGRRDAVRAGGPGTKLGLHHAFDVDPGTAVSVRLRLRRELADRPFDDFERVIQERRREADAFHREVAEGIADPDLRRVQRQALAGLLWSKQVYYFDVPQWFDGDPAQPTPPPERRRGRNAEWLHFNSADVLSVPDKWEYPWFAAWDLAFHCIPLALVDPTFAKQQLVLLTREWFMHPNGQLPAYEWAFGDANPPVHAWAAWRVYEIDRARNGRADRAFLERIFHKLLLNFTWWVNRKDLDGRNVFQGGFLGLDNIGPFDRSAGHPGGERLDQADATGWMAMYSLDLMRIALELARENRVYEDVATKFFEHFLYITAAMNDVGGMGIELWDPEEEFFFDVVRCPSGGCHRLKIRSLVGLTPLFAVDVLDAEQLQRAPDFASRLRWFLRYRPDLAGLVSRWHEPGRGDTRLLALLRGHRMKRVLRRMLDEREFLSDFGIRSLSRHHLDHPYRMELDGATLSVEYQPGESRSALFGGNSNWRGPVWVPMNYLIIESLRRFHRYYGEDFKVECPTGSGVLLSLREIADELARRVTRLFARGDDGRRPFQGAARPLPGDPDPEGHLLFHEFFDGDSGRGVGASHQTGWTALVAELLLPRVAEARGPGQVASTTSTETSRVSPPPPT